MRAVLISTLFAVMAEAADGAPSEAARLFDEGRVAFKAGDVGTACPAFARSYELEPVLGTLLNWAACLEKQGRFATAWLRFNDAIDWAQRTHESEREQFAREHAKALRPSVSWLVLSAPSEVEARVDGKVVRVSSTAVSLPVELGTHLVEVTAPGFEPWSSKVSVAQAGQSVSLAVVLARSAPAVSAVSPPPARSEPSGVHLPVETHGARLAGGVSLIIAGSLVALAGAVGLAWSFSTYDLLQQQRADAANPQLRVSMADFERLRWVPGVSWAGLGVGAAALTAGIVMVATSRSVLITPTLSGGGGGLVVSGSF